MLKNKIVLKTKLYRVYRETLATAHRKVDRMEMNIKVPYHLAIFAIIIEILIFEIVLKGRQEKRSSRSRYSPAQFINIGFGWRFGENRGKAHHCSVPTIAAPTSRHPAPKNSMVVTHNRDYNIMRQITIHIITLQK